MNQFGDRERAIFQYHNGTAAMYADPMALHRKLSHALGGDIAKAVGKTRSEIAPEAYGAMERFLAAVRIVFEMTAFDSATGRGATEGDCLDVYEAFLDFEASKKNSSKSPATWQQPTDSGVWANLYPSSCSTDSGSTD